MLLRGAACWFVLVLATGTGGCVRTTAFECESAADCVDAGVHGRCEPNGFCSFPDASCPSQRRYGDHAGDGLGGVCVAPDDGTTGIADTGDDTLDPATSATSSSSNAETTPLSDSSSGAVTLATDVSGATTSDDDTTFDPTDASASSSESGATTTGGGEPVCPSFVDDFEDGIIDASWSLMDGEFVEEVGGELVFELSVELDAVFPGVLRTDQDLASGEVRIHVGQAPSSDSERLYLAVAADEAFSDVVYIMIEGGVLLAEREHGSRWTYYAETTYDPLDHAWLQIRGADDAVYFEFSSDGESFDTLFSVEAPFPLSATTVVVASTNFVVLPAVAYVSIADFEICEGP